MKRDRKRAKLAWYVACVLALSPCLGCKNITAGQKETPSRTFRVMTFNIHHGEGLDGKVDLQRIASLIEREQADVVGLQEVDKGVQRTARRDIPAELAILTGMTCVFSNNSHYQGGEYGNAVLTRFPVLSATNSHYQMLRTNEQRGMLQVTVEVMKHRVLFVNTHIDYRADDTERLLNVKELQSIAAQHAGIPIVLCGDFNDIPDSRVHQQLQKAFDDAWELAGRDKGWTYPAKTPRKRIDYVWISKLLPFEVIGAYVPESAASDHRPLIVEFRFK